MGGYWMGYRIMLGREVQGGPMDAIARNEGEGVYLSALTTASNTAKQTYSHSDQSDVLREKESEAREGGRTILTGIARRRVGPNPLKKTDAPSSRYELRIVDDTDR